MAPKRNRLKRVRKSTGLSQEDLAHRLGVDASTVWRWEAGRTEPEAWQQPRLARLLGVTRAELVRLLAGEVEASEPAVLAPSVDEHQNLPVVLQDSGSAPDQSVVVSMLGPSRTLSESVSDLPQHHQQSGSDNEAVLQSAYFESVALNRNLEASSLGAATLGQLAAAVENFGIDYLHVPPSRTLRDAGITRRFVIDALDGRHTFAQRKQLYAIGGWLSALIGHGSFDVGESYGIVDGHLTTALHLANEIDHKDLISWIRGTQALSAVFRNRPQAAIRCAQSGLEVAEEHSIMKVRLLAQKARAHARLGDRKRAEQCMSAAERSFDKVVEPLSTSIFSFDRPYLSYYAGTCYSWLGKPSLAEKQSREAIIMCDRAPDDWPVARVFARIDLAEVLVQQNELDEAVELARDCLDICVYGRRTVPMENRVRDLLASLGTAIGISPTRHLTEQFHAVFRDGIGTSHGS